MIGRPPFAFEKVEQGVFTVSLGGHFMDGAWALTMIHDLHHGRALDDTRSRSTWAAATNSVESVLSHL